jgi:outer membrane protein OmpA-like peptidoglycan-associated protein
MNTRSKCAVAITLAIISVPTIASSNSEVWTTSNGSAVVDGNGNPIRTIHYKGKALVALTQAAKSKDDTEQVVMEKVKVKAKEPLVKVATQAVIKVLQIEPKLVIPVELKPVKIIKPIVKDKVKEEVKEEVKQVFKSVVVVETPVIIEQPEVVIAPIMEEPKVEYRFNNYQTTVLFDTASATLSADASGSLKQLVMATGLAQSVISVQVIGHADTRGDEAYNMTLSEQRMRSVSDFLEGLKLKVTSMFAKGETSPVIDDQGEDLAKSRRVHVAIKTRHLKD